LRGYVWVLPGATQAPADLYEYRRTHRTQRVPVRNGAFTDSGLSPGPAIVVADLRGLGRVAVTATIPGGGMLDLDLTVPAR
jgi:hypothetical protein